VKNRKFAIAICMIAMSPATVIAADGTITFNGKVTDKTCSISGASKGKNIVVTLPTVSRGALASVGEVAGRTSFIINLSECSKGQIATYFEPGQGVDYSSGRLVNQAKANAAGNVQVQLLGSNGNLLPVKTGGENMAQENSQWATVADDGSASLVYSAEYYATGVATAGDVLASVKYTIIYK